MCAFIPHALPPTRPALALDAKLELAHQQAIAALGRLAVAGRMVPSAQWFLYGFVRKEALVSSQIEGTQATFDDVVAYETTRQSDRRADVEEVCNYVEAMTYARVQLAHVQFETIHPFLDGNGRIGRLLVGLLVEHGGLIDQPLLYLIRSPRRSQ